MPIFLSGWKEFWANLTTHPHSTLTSAQESLLYTARPANRLLFSALLDSWGNDPALSPCGSSVARLQHPQFLPRSSSSSRSLPFSVHTRSILLELHSWNPCQSVESELSESPTQLSWTTFLCWLWLQRLICSESHLNLFNKQFSNHIAFCFPNRISGQSENFPELQVHNPFFLNSSFLNSSFLPQDFL